jgi:addiction module HigA family antidote
MESLRDKNRKPTHGGAILREDILPALNMTQGELAEKLKVSRRTISEILHEKRPITPDMAIRIGVFTNTTPQSWLNMQQTLDIWQLQQSNAKTYAEIERVAA